MNVKHKILGVVMLSLLPLSLSAQSEMEAFRLNSPYDPMGSARFAALSGAMGAVGSDASSLVRNPAGISLFRGSNRLSLTLGGGWGLDQGVWYGSTSTQEFKSKMLFDEFSYQAGTNRATRGPISFAFSIRNAGRFDRELHASATLPQQGNYSSLADFAAGRTNNARYDNSSDMEQYFTKRYLTSKEAFHNQDVPYLSILGAGAGWIDRDGDKSYHSAYSYSISPEGTSHDHPNNGLPDKAALVLREKGSITDYDIAFGLEANEAMHFGAVLTLSSQNYELSSFYQELLRENTLLTLQNTKSISGFGGRLGLGFLYEPTDGLRLGASIYTPTFYTVKTSFQAHSKGIYKGDSGEVGTPRDATTYSLRSPWRFGISGAYFVGRYGFLSADYEYTGGALRLSNNTYNEYDNSEAGFEVDNAHLKTNFGGTHTLRLGAEVMIGSRIALRTGYRYSTSPIKNERLRGTTVSTEAIVFGSVVHYTLPDNQSSYSIGAGFRLTPSLSLDLAYVYSQTNARTFAFPTLNDYGIYFDVDKEERPNIRGQHTELVGMEGIKETNQRHKAIATLSLRF